MNRKIKEAFMAFTIAGALFITTGCDEGYWENLENTEWTSGNRFEQMENPKAGAEDADKHVDLRRNEELYVDVLTGVVYLREEQDTGIGWTPLFNANGMPMIAEGYRKE